MRETAAVHVTAAPLRCSVPARASADHLTAEGPAGLALATSNEATRKSDFGSAGSRGRSWAHPSSIYQDWAHLSSIYQDWAHPRNIRARHQDYIGLWKRSRQIEKAGRWSNVSFASFFDRPRQSPLC